jgi:hypothetical protein
MNNRESPYHVEAGVEFREKERDPRVPIINIVRHGETDYKELNDPTFKFDPEAPEFKLDAEHLDLTEEGIKNILETAQQLVATIDKENEVVVLYSSPNFRARSSNLLIEKVLVENGITVLNSKQSKVTNEPSANPDGAKAGKATKGVKISAALEQIKFKDPAFMPTWIGEDKKYREEDRARQKERPRVAHEAIARRLGKSIPEVFSRDHDALNARFQDWLRRMINIDKLLSQKTKDQNAGKKIRIIATTHEEIPDMFIQQALDSETNLAKGQMMEIQANGMLEPGGSTDAEVILYGKGESAGKAGHAAIAYHPEKAQK